MDSPPIKRIKLESPPPAGFADMEETEEDAVGEHCSICLQPYADRTVIPTCSHEFCLECLLIWTGEPTTNPPTRAISS